MYPNCFKMAVPSKIDATNNVNTDGGFSLVKRNNLQAAKRPKKKGMPSI